MATPVPLDENLAKFMNSYRLGAAGKKRAGRKITIYAKPKLGKTVLAARLGKHNMFISDEDGYTSLMNESVKPLIGHWDAVPFEDWGGLQNWLQAGEAGQILCECGEPIDNWVIDTINGAIGISLKQIIKSAGTPAKGRVAPEAPGLPDYMISRDRLIPVMQRIASMRNASVTILAHMREHGEVEKLVGPDVHWSAAEVINKYTSVQAYLTMTPKGRVLQVRPTDNKVIAGTRYDFPSDFVTDDDFVAHIEKWKNSEILEGAE